MKQKGFTLIELLAVIVVLAVIALIAIPIITSVIDKAKVGALKDSAYGILDSAEMYLAKNMSKGIDDTMEFTCNNGKCLSGEEEINYKGKIESGKVRIYADSKIELCVTDNKSSALKTIANKKVEVVAGTCNYGELNYDVSALVSKDDYDKLQSKYDELINKVNESDATSNDIKLNKKAVTSEYATTKNYTVGNLDSADFTYITSDSNSINQTYSLLNYTNETGKKSKFLLVVAMSGQNATYTITEDTSIGLTEFSSSSSTITVGYNNGHVVKTYIVELDVNETITIRISNFSRMCASMAVIQI